MKYLWLIPALLMLALPSLAEDFVVTEAEYVVISGNVSDTLGRTRLTPDSIRISVTDSSGTELHDAWYESADAQCALNGDVIVFFDQWEDINGSASVGIFHVMTTIASDAQNNVDLYSNYNYTLRGVTVGVEQTFNEVGITKDTAFAIIDSIQAYYKFVTDSQQVIIDALQGTLDVNIASVDNDAINLKTDVTEVLPDSNIATIDVNMAQISGDGTAADNLETMLDSTGGKPLTVSQLVIESGGDNNAVHIVGSGGGEGINVTGGATAHGAHIIAGSSIGQGVRIEAQAATSYGLAIYGGASVADVDIDLIATSFYNGVVAADTNVSGDTIMRQKDTTACQGAGALTAADIFNFDIGDYSDSGGNDDAGYFLYTAGDTGGWADLDDVWQNRDTTNTIDTSDMGDWFRNNVGTGGTDTASIKTMLNNNSFAKTGTGVVWQLRGLYIKAVGTDSTALWLEGNGAGEGFYAKAGATGHGMQVVGGATSGSGLVASAVGGGHGINAVGAATGGGIEAVGGLTSGSGIYAYARGGNSAGLQAGKHGTGWDILADTVSFGRFIAAMTDDSLSDVHGAGSWTLAGAGNDTLRINVIDSSRADSVVSDVHIVATTATGIKAEGRTNDSGWVNLLLDAATDYSVTGRGPSPRCYTADATTFTNTAGFNPTTDTLWGWTIVSPAAAGTKTCNVKVVLRDNAGDAVEGVLITAKLTRSNVIDSAGYGVTNPTQRQWTDATGSATFTCRWSSYLIPATQWLFTSKIGGVRERYTVPREASVTLDLSAQ